NTGGLADQTVAGGSFTGLPAIKGRAGCPVLRRRLASCARDRRVRRKHAISRFHGFVARSRDCGTDQRRTELDQSSRTVLPADGFRRTHLIFLVSVALAADELS